MFKKKYSTQEKKTITLLALSQKIQSKSRASSKNINTMEQKLQVLKDKISQKKLQAAAKNIKKSTDIKDKAENFLSASKISPQKHLSQKSQYLTNQSFVEILSQLKMSSYAQAFQQKNISTKQEILALSKDEINQMTNIPIGYRIKLIKKILESQKSKKSQMQIRQKEYEIQSIIKKRKQMNKFEPLPAKEQNEKNTDSRENNADCFNDQEVKILDEIATFFQWKKEDKQNQNMTQNLMEEEKKYCWQCFNRIGQELQNCRFCCGRCQQSFKSKTKIDEMMLQANQQAEIQWEQNSLLENEEVADEQEQQDDFYVDLTIV